jgi:hypothetical protein
MTPATRWAVRIPVAGAAFAALFIFFLLARLVVGDAAGILAAALLAVSAPWVEAGTSALPLIVGEMLVLLGVVWALILQSRHREVEVAGVTSARIGMAGVFLGIGLLLAPAAMATFLTTALIWFLLGLRRASSSTTTLPVEAPRRTALYAFLGTIVLVTASVLAAGFVESKTGGRGLPFLSMFGPHLERGIEIWRELYRGLLSPTGATDRIVLGAIGVILLVRAIEWWTGRPWRSAGFLPWVLLAAYIWVLRGTPDGADGLAVPIIGPPLFVLGLAWVFLRGLRPGRIRRQEYTFLITWLAVGIGFVPFMPGGQPHDPLLAATVTLLLPVLLFVGRGVRALFESSDTEIGRVGVIGLAYLPVVLFVAGALSELFADSAGLAAAHRWLERSVPAVLLVAVGLGLLSDIVSVRPEVPAARRPRPRRRFRSPRGRRGGKRRGGRRPHG